MGLNGFMVRKFFPEKFTISVMLLTMMYYKRGQTFSSFLANKPTTSPVQGPSEIFTLENHKIGPERQWHSLNIAPLGFASTRAACDNVNFC